VRAQPRRLAVLLGCAAVGEVIRNATDSPTSEIAAPSRIAQRLAASAMSLRMSSAVSTSVPTHTSAIEPPMTCQSRASKSVSLLKWLAFPRSTCPMMTTISTARNPAATAEAIRTVRGAFVVSDVIHAQVSA
jgi:hypothetical protein